MVRHEASFEIDSKRDSHAARRIVERVYDTVREETQNDREDAADARETLREFETLRESARRPAPGTLTIVYERYDEDEFDD